MFIRFLFFVIVIFKLQSCTTRKYYEKQLLPKGIKSLVKEIYSVENNQKELLQRKQLILTKNGRIKTSKTWDASGVLIQENEKRLWFVKESNIGLEPYYCKTRWKPNRRERISCYSQKKHKQNEAIYHYNTDGTIAKIADNFTTFYTQYYYYTSNELSKIVTKDKNNNLIDEVQINCEIKDDKGTCLKQIRTSSKTADKFEILLFPIYY